MVPHTGSEVHPAGKACPCTTERSAGSRPRRRRQPSLSPSTRPPPAPQPLTRRSAPVHCTADRPTAPRRRPARRRHRPADHHRARRLHDLHPHRHRRRSRRGRPNVRRTPARRPMRRRRGSRRWPALQRVRHREWTTPEVSDETEVWLDVTINAAGVGVATTTVPFVPLTGAGPWSSTRSRRHRPAGPVAVRRACR